MSGEVRLYHVYSLPFYFRGRVEVFMLEEWGTVATASSWTIQNAAVVCSQLGFEIPCKTTMKNKYTNNVILFSIEGMQSI